MTRIRRTLALTAAGVAAVAALGVALAPASPAAQIIGHDSCGNPTVHAAVVTVQPIPCPGPVLVHP